MRLKLRAMAVLITALALSTATSLGGGLIETLPEDGTYAKFNLNTVAKLASGRESIRNETITISSVGTREIDGKPCRWIEIAHGGIRRPIAGMLDQTTDVDTFLIPEAAFEADSYPLNNAVEVWRQASNHEMGKPTQMSARDQRQARRVLVDLQQFLHGRPMKVRELPAKMINHQLLGMKECAGIGYEESFKNGRSDRFDTKYEVWLHKDAPFGVVEMSIERQIFRNEELNRTETSKLVLWDLGKEAVGTIQEAR